MSKRNKTPRWKREQKKRKRQMVKWQMILGVGFVVLIGLLILGRYFLVQVRKSVWNGWDRLGVVRQTEKEIKVQVAVPEQDRLVEISLPLSTLVKVPFFYGEYQIEKVYKLGSLENKGGKLLMLSVQDLLAIGIQGFITEDKTNFSWWDKLKWQYFNKIRYKKKVSLDLAQTSSLTEKELTDGQVVFKPNLILIDELINQHLFDEEVVDENLSLAVLNASKVEGVASQVSRLISNLGVEVLLVDDLEEENESVILVSNKKLLNSKTVKQIRNNLSIKNLEIGDLKEYRVEVVVKIGKDYTIID